MIRHTLHPLHNGNFLLKMQEDFENGACIQTTEITAEDVEEMLRVLEDNRKNDATGDSAAG